MFNASASKSPFFSSIGTTGAITSAPSTAFTGFGAGLGTTAISSAPSTAFTGFGAGLGTTAISSAPSTAFTGFGAGLGTTAISSAPSTAFTGFGAGLGTTAISSAPSTAFTGFGTGLGTAVASSASSITGFGGGLKLNTAPLATTNTSGFSFGGFGASNLANRPTTGFGLTAPLGATPAVPQSRGLGGVSLSGVGINSLTSTSSGMTAQGQRETKQGKDTLLPNEIIQTVEDFKKFLAEQKKLREELPKFTARPLQKVSAELSTLKQQVTQVENSLKRNVAQTRKLKEDVAHEEKNLGIAQRSSESSSVLQYENVAPTIYFTNMAYDFETRLRLYKQEIDAIEGLMTSQAHGNLTPKELVDVFKRMDDDFIGLAAKLYSVHEGVRKQKTEYIKRRRGLGDTRDPFSSLPASKRRDSTSPRHSAHTTTRGGNGLSQHHHQPPTTLGPSAFQTSWAAPGFAAAGQIAGAAPPTQTLGSAQPGLTGFSFGTQPPAPASTASGGFSFGGLTGFNTAATNQPSTGLFNATGGSNMFVKPAVPTLQPPPQGKKKKPTAFSGF